ncbi:hypothetical protein GF357_03310 [Candidatus Dojkabacteria bacterium]|nr:hypothetical protein [Candidatus Dojkabacteria bacterium]
MNRNQLIIIIFLLVCILIILLLLVEFDNNPEPREIKRIEESDIVAAESEILPLPEPVIRQDEGEMVTNERVEELRTLYLKNASIEPGNTDASPVRIEKVILRLEDGNIEVLEGVNTLNGDFHYRDIYLASISKEYITDAFLNELSAGNLSDAQEVSIYVLSEIIRRSKGQRLIDGYQEYKEILEQAGITRSFIERNVGSDAGADRIVSRIQNSDERSFKLSSLELVKVTLKYSCNYATGHLDQVLKDLKGGPDEYYDYMISQYPGFHVKKSLEDGLHFVQYDANTGDLINLMKHQNQLVQDWQQGELSEVENEIFELRIDNDHDFTFNLGASDWLEDFVKEYKEETGLNLHFIEKTGYYPSIYWIENQGEVFPPFMFMGSVFTVFFEDMPSAEIYNGNESMANSDVQINHNPITFAYYEVVEVAHPDEKVHPNFWDGQTYSYEWSDKEDKDYILPIKYGLARDFRERLKSILLVEFMGGE